LPELEVKALRETAFDSSICSPLENDGVCAQNLFSMSMKCT